MMNIFRNFLCISFFCGFTNMVNCQSYVDVGFQVGLANYSGDLSPSNVGPIIAQSNVTFGGFLKYNMNPRFSTRLSAVYANISGSDALSGNDQMKLRNLSFESDIYELAAILEFNIFEYCVIEGESRFSPTAFVGFGAFKFDPKTEYNGTTIRLQPLGTEGQGTSAAPNNAKYNLVQLNIPFGGGVKFKAGENITIFSELSWRWTFTDYLDDVSTIYADPDILLSESGDLAVKLSNRTGEFLGQEGYVSNGPKRGGPDVNDYYFTGTVGISFALHNSSSNLSTKRKKSRRKSAKVKCPKF